VFDDGVLGMERIEMSAGELKRLEVLSQVVGGSLSQVQAGVLLSLTVRQVRRLQRRFEAAGAAGLVSARRGKPSGRRKPEALKCAVLQRVQECYRDFGPTLAAEYLHAEGLSVSKETLRRWLMAAGLWRSHRKCAKRRHPPRERRTCCGELVQIDASLHDWFEGRGPRCTLVAFIDDASSEVVYARFAPVESSQAYLDGVHAYVARHGCPVSFYSDRHGIFTKHDPEDGTPTQFGRALQALDIEGICALTPQAKGRIERLFKTLQDRLVKAMRLAGIGHMDHANAFLERYIPAHNARFAVPPTEPHNAHRPWRGGEQTLARICAIHHERRLSKDLVLSFQRQRYIVQTHGQPCYALRGQRVTVVVYPDRRVEVLHGQRILEVKVFDPEQDVSVAVDEKTLNARVDQALSRRSPATSWRPAPNHPWRRWEGETPPARAHITAPAAAPL